VSAADRTFDAIVVGAGHNGMTLAGYLQRAGLTTVVVEAAFQVGGMTATTAPLLPGHLHNPHANYLMYQDLMHAMRDLALERFGLRMVHPAAQHGITFADGRPPIVLHRPDLLDRTKANLSLHATADASTFAELRARASRLRALLGEGMYWFPQRQWFSELREQVIGTYGDMVASASLGRETARDLIDGMFRATELRTLLYRISAEFGADVAEPGTDVSFLAMVLPTVGNLRLPLGGMRELAAALHASCRSAGVTFICGADVESIVTRGGRAVGVLARGVGNVWARQLVASSLSVADTELDLVDDGPRTAERRRELEHFRARRSSVLASSMFCLRDAPDYLSARWDPDINHCAQTMIGIETTDEALAHMADVSARRLPAPAAAVRVNSLWDRSQAPPGRHTAGADSVFPDLEPAVWAGVEEHYNRALLERWAACAPNMRSNNVLAERFFAPGRYERKALLCEGQDQYRSSVDRLYVCGSTTHPGGGVHGACGYNAYRVIVADLAHERRARRAQPAVRQGRKSSAAT
jgi:phytoene dehydrogenase-like protein